MEIPCGKYIFSKYIISSILFPLSNLFSKYIKNTNYITYITNK